MVFGISMKASKRWLLLKTSMKSWTGKIKGLVSVSEEKDSFSHNSAAKIECADGKFTRYIIEQIHRHKQGSCHIRVCISF